MKIQKIIHKGDWYGLTKGELEFEIQQAKDWVEIVEFSTQCDGNPASEYGGVNADRSKMRQTKVNSGQLGGKRGPIRVNKAPKSCERESCGN